ncbi:hypothetical protein KKF61_07465 [Patescibacteria group bacterium]|nr:hypothetical protein [Patescibacteria group bacterium]
MTKLAIIAIIIFTGCGYLLGLNSGGERIIYQDKIVKEECEPIVECKQVECPDCENPEGYISKLQDCNNEYFTLKDEYKQNTNRANSEINGLKEANNKCVEYQNIINNKVITLEQTIREQSNSLNICYEQCKK